MEELKTAEAWAYYLSDELQLDPAGQETLIYDLENDNAEDWVPILEDENIDSYTIGDFCKFFKLDINTIYTVELSFNGYIGANVEMEIEAPYGSTENEISDILNNNYEDELSDFLVVEEVLGDDIDDRYMVTISFDGQSGTETDYAATGEDEDEAAYEATQEALNDIELVSFIYKRD